ncbi:MAG: hypothetical protein ACD_28C00108G0022 [uncultured bacterium]|nr:MAG: hypothetical protein ACD_28C00108G0022 [uncultured bacterium]KKT75381.1 MAG: N5-carboxyaminoimidazole ribonucleotide mutase [Candidatus Peregrinibacteria bacterium GW2011_GWA2_44_7]
MISSPRVAILMGSKSDWPTMEAAKTILSELGIPSESRVISAHRTPSLLHEYVKEASGRGIEIFIAGAGGAAHLPGVIAALTPLPVIGVPIQSGSLNGLDALLAIVQMPGGVPVATVGINNAKNAGLLAARILALKDPKVDQLLRAFIQKLEVDGRAGSILP